MERHSSATRMVRLLYDWGRRGGGGCVGMCGIGVAV